MDAQKDKKHISAVISKNSGVALRQMNYEVAKNLTKEELQEKKK